MEGSLTQVIEALASAEDVSPAELSPPLADAVDPDALGRLLASGTVRVTFEYEGREVTVTSDGDVQVTPRVKYTGGRNV